jgi:hypothetical protein
MILQSLPATRVGPLLLSCFLYPWDDLYIEGLIVEFKMTKLPHNSKNRGQLQKAVMYNDNSPTLKGSLRIGLTYLGIFPLNAIFPKFVGTYSIPPENSFHLGDFFS